MRQGRDRKTKVVNRLHGTLRVKMLSSHGGYVAGRQDFCFSRGKKGTLFENRKPLLSKIESSRGQGQAHIGAAQ